MNASRSWWTVLFLSVLIAGPVNAQARRGVQAGVLTVNWGDPAAGSAEPSRLIGLLTAADGKTTRIELTPELIAAVGGLRQIDHRRVEVTLRGNGSDASAIRQVETLHIVGSIAEAAVSGSQPWVSILCKFSDVPAEPKNLSYFLGMYANSMGGLDHYWRQVSYDQINVVGSTAVNWVTLPQTRAFYLPGGTADLNTLFNDCTAAANPFVDFSNGGTGGYVGINMMFNADLDCCAWGGGHFATLDGVTKVWRTTWEPPWGYSSEGVIAHEMGHGFGLPHSNNSDNDGWPYDSPWDVMSDSWGYALDDAVYGTLGKHTISYHKDSLGWIPADKRFEVLKNGSYNITLDSLAAASATDYRMAKIRMPGASRFLTFESREQDGYDGALAGEAVILHEVVANRGEPAWLIDANQPPADYSDNEGVMWRPGETFNDPSGQLQMTVNGAAGSGFNVTLVSSRSGALWNENFEAGSGEFSGSDLWHRTSACAASQAGHSGPSAYYFGIDAQCNYAAGGFPLGGLLSPAINLAGLAPPLTLTFNYFLETQPGGSDQVLLYVLPEGGGFQVAARNTPGPWVTLADPSGGWQTASIDLQPFAGSNIYLEFQVAANSSANNFPGFYVDDVTLWSCFSAETLGLSSQTISSPQTFRACDTLTAGPSFQIAVGGDVRLRAGKRIALNGGFSVAPGGKLSAVVGPPEQ